MKFLVLILSIATLVLCNDLDAKKRAAPKQNNINSIQGNSHQKPGDVSFIYQQQQQQQPGPISTVYPQTNPNQPYSTLPGPLNYQQPDPQSYYQPGLNFGPPVFPFQYIPQQKLQVVPTKLPNGQTQYSIIPQQFVYPQQLPQYQQNGAVQQQPQTTQSSYLPSNNPQQQYQQPNIYYPQPHIIPQPSTMFLFSQPPPQLYANYLQPNPNLLYTNAAQQLLHYYQTNPQAKYQLLYGNQQNQNPNPNSYQPQLSGTEYDKIVPGPISQNLAKSDGENALNTNEYYAQESSFKPVNSYGNRVGGGGQTYKN